MEKKSEGPDNSLQEVLKNIILRFWNGNNVKKVFVGKFEILGGSSRSKVWRFFASFEELRGTFVCKAPQEQGGQWTDRDGRLLNEVSALDFLGKNLSGRFRSYVPKLVGVDLEAKVVVLEEISPIRGRLDGVLQGSVKVQGGVEQALLKFVSVLAKVHGCSARNIKDLVDARSNSLLKSKKPPNSSTVRGLVEVVHEVLGKEVDCEGFVKEMEKAFESSFDLQGDFCTLIHADLCPENILILNKSGDVTIIDYEFSRPGNALMDVSFLRTGFPTCWCVGKLPKEMLKKAERLYREQVKDDIPAVLDKLKVLKNG